MSVNYTCYYGIGYKVEKSAEIPEDELEDGLYEYIISDLDNDVFECFEEGNYYTGEFGGVYVVVKNSLRSGLDLSPLKASLDAELVRLKLTPVGDFGLVGGLLVD